MRKWLVIGKVWPEPASSAAGTRMMQLLMCLKQHGMDIIFGSAASRTEYSEALDLHGITVADLRINDPGFDRFVAELRPDVVMFDRFTTEEQFGWRVAQQCPDALRILDTEDLHGVRAAREQALLRNRTFARDDLHNDVSRREVASIYRSDLSLVISDSEMELLRSVFRVPAALLIRLPFLYRQLSRDTVASWPSYGERTDFVFVGNYLHAPNRDALQYLRDRVWPLIRRRLPDARINIYGAYMGEPERAVHDPNNGMYVHGRVQEVESVIKMARLSLAPLRFGAGQKGKIADSFRCGTPCVTTPIGAEGMGNGEDWPGAIAGDEDEFAENSVHLYNSREAWEPASAACALRFNNLFNGQRHGKAFMERVAGLKANLTEHRMKNFTGSVLMHQSLHATRWLAKYIELKNATQAEKTELE